MKIFFNKNWLLILLITLAIFTRFWHLKQPAEVVFDEVHFGKFVSAYFNNEYYFDIHPPLGKMMIALSGKILGFNPGSDFKEIGEALNEKDLFALRFLPALFGVFFVVIIYYLLLALNISKLGSFAGAFMVLFENTILVESKFILVDMFLLCFGFAALLFFIKFQKSTGKWQTIYFICTSVLLGLAYGIKFTGLSFLGIVLLFNFVRFFKDLEFKKFVFSSFGFVLISGLTYLIFFPIHFSILYKSGPGDAYMTASFQKTLEGNKINVDNSDEKLNTWGKIFELNKAMFGYSYGLTATHPDGSKWYEWPQMKKPVYYWVKSAEGGVRNIYLIGNPLLWLASSLSVMIALVLLFIKKIRKKLQPEIWILIVGYCANLFPFIKITRVAFLYHYLIALVFSILILVLLIDRLLISEMPDGKNKKHVLMDGKFKRKYLIFYILGLGLIFASFIIISPLTYGLFTASELSSNYSKFINILH